MARAELIASFAGPDADAPTREAAAECVAWIEAHARTPRLLVFGASNAALACLLASPSVSRVVLLVDEAEREAADVVVAGQPPEIRNRVVIASELSPEARFDTAVIAPGAASGRTPGIVSGQIALALAILHPGGRLIVTVPFSKAFTPRTLIPLLREKLTPHALFARGEYLRFWGTSEPSSAEAWVPFASPDALLVLTEAAALEARALDSQRRDGLHRTLRGLSVSATSLARSMAHALRVTLDQSRLLRQAVERTRCSARYQLGSALIAAVKPSADTFRLPARLFGIYRAKSTGRTGAVSATSAEARRIQLLDERLDSFLSLTRHSSPARVVVMFSGALITGVRGDRPYALARALLRRDVPVIFGYNGTLRDGELPPYGNPHLLELPVDYLTTRLDTIAAAPFALATKKLFIVSYPIAAVAPFVNRFNTHGWVTAYDSLDDWEEFAHAGVAGWYSRSVERFIVNNADFTACVSHPLQTKLQSFTDSRDVLLSPNAYDPAFRDPNYRRRPGHSVTVGYFGHLTPAWFDWGSLGAIARRRPNYLFQIIGHGAPSDLDLPPNISLLGLKTPRAICRYAESWAAAIIPFKVGKLADAVDPIKVYEYLALRLPVVSFRMPQISGYPYTRTVHTTEEFVAALDLAVTTQVDDGTITAFLGTNTWDQRVDALLDRADRVLAAAPFEKRLHEPTTARA